jgi:hypothetical protein
MQKVRRVLIAVWLLAGEAAAVAALARLGRRPPFRVPLTDLGGWLRSTPPTDALAAALRVVALLVACWLLAATVVYALACLARVPRAARWLVPAALRRVVDGAVVVAVAGALVAPAAVAAADPTPVTVSVRDGREPVAVSASVAAPDPPPSPGTSDATPAAAARAADVVVVPGDDFWVLATARAAADLGRDPASLTAAEVAPYWQRVCDANRDRIRSGDVDLIYPGEVVTLPDPA